ncbi:MAG TPA: NAD(P)-binding domain-containing protein [Vicinamibacteria bacterium]
MAPSVGFIGGGRITRVILTGWKRSGYWPARVVVSDTNAQTLDGLRAAFPDIVAVLDDNFPPVREEVVFLAVHPPVMRGVLAEVRGRVSPGALLVSLAPKLTIAELAAALGGFARIGRVIPNAPSLVGAGFNPVAFSPVLSPADRQALGALLAPLGASPEVPEPDLEAYAVLTGMGPTYLWFQLYELLSLSEGFGLGRAAAVEALGGMVGGAVRTMTDSGLSPGDVMNLVPVRPLAEDEEAFKSAYRARLQGVFEKIRPAVVAV